jgi:anti-anti-sigma factor
MALKIDIQDRGNNMYLVTVLGRLDTETYSAFEEKIRSVLTSKTNVLIVDLNGLDYISSAGLGVLFYAKKIIEGNKGTFLLINLQPQIKKVFEVVKVLPNMRSSRALKR